MCDVYVDVGLEVLQLKEIERIVPKLTPKKTFKKHKMSKSKLEVLVKRKNCSMLV
jgi:hypothetical protein